MSQQFVYFDNPNIRNLNEKFNENIYLFYHILFCIRTFGLIRRL